MGPLYQEALLHYKIMMASLTAVGILFSLPSEIAFPPFKGAVPYSDVWKLRTT